MDKITSLLNEISPFWASVSVAYIALLGGLIYGKLYLEKNSLSPRFQPVMVWNSRLHALFLIWYSAALLDLPPSILTVEDEHFYTIYWINRLYIMLDLDYFAFPASERSKSIPNLKFLDEQTPLPFIQVMLSRNPPTLVWKWFAALDEAHWALVYSYLGKLWGHVEQGDQDLSGTRIMRRSRKAHVLVSIAVGVYCLYLRSWEAFPEDKVWMRRMQFVCLVIHLISSVTDLAGTSIIRAIIGLFSRSDDKSGETSAATTEKTSVTATEKSEDRGRQSVEKSDTNS